MKLSFSTGYATAGYTLCGWCFGGEMVGRWGLRGFLLGLRRNHSISLVLAGNFKVG
jgi:hypothetical protein